MPKSSQCKREVRKPSGTELRFACTFLNTPGSGYGLWLPFAERGYIGCSYFPDASYMKGKEQYVDREYIINELGKNFIPRPEDRLFIKAETIDGSSLVRTGVVIRDPEVILSLASFQKRFYDEQAQQKVDMVAALTDRSGYWQQFAAASRTQPQQGACRYQGPVSGR